jgi:hypothetical protein
MRRSFGEKIESLVVGLNTGTMHRVFQSLDYVRIKLFITQKLEISEGQCRASEHFRKS